MAYLSGERHPPPPKKKPFVSYVLYIACVQLSPPLKKKETNIIWGEGMVVHTLWCGIPPVSLVIFLIHVITPQKLRVRKLHIQTLMDPHPVINPLSPKSDQHQFSPHNINALAKVKVMRFNKMIISGKMLWSFTKFSQLIFQGNVWRSVWRICWCISGLKGLKQG